MNLQDIDLREIDDISDIFDIENEEREEIIINRVPKRYIRDGYNPFQFYDNKEFKRRFRFSKEAVTYGLLPKVEEGLAKVNKQGLPIAPILQLLVCLRFYATASFQVIKKVYIFTL